MISVSVGPGEQIDADATEQLPLRLGDERIAWPYQHIDGGMLDVPSAIAATA